MSAPTTIPSTEHVPPPEAPQVVPPVGGFSLTWQDGLRIMEFLCKRFERSTLKTARIHVKGEETPNGITGKIEYDYETFIKEVNGFDGPILFYACSQAHRIFRFFVLSETNKLYQFGGGSNGLFSMSDYDNTGIMLLNVTSRLRSWIDPEFREWVDMSPESTTQLPSEAFRDATMLNTIRAMEYYLISERIPTDLPQFDRSTTEVRISKLLQSNMMEYVPPSPFKGDTPKSLCLCGEGISLSPLTKILTRSIRVIFGHSIALKWSTSSLDNKSEIWVRCLLIGFGDGDRECIVYFPEDGSFMKLPTVSKHDVKLIRLCRQESSTPEWRRILNNPKFRHDRLRRPGDFVPLPTGYNAYARSFGGVKRPRGVDDDEESITKKARLDPSDTL